MTVVHGRAVARACCDRVPKLRNLQSWLKKEAIFALGRLFRQAMKSGSGWSHRSALILRALGAGVDFISRDHALRNRFTPKIESTGESMVEFAIVISASGRYDPKPLV